MANDFPTVHAYLIGICVLIIGVPDTNSTSICSGSGSTIFNGICYRYYAERATWFEAKRMCEEQDGVLASVSSLDQIKSFFVTQNLLDEAWVGVTDLAIEGRYVWIQDNRLANEDLQDLWFAGEPNNVNKANETDEDCVSVYSDLTLNDDTCSGAHPYVCTGRTKLHELLMNCPDGMFGYKCRYTCHCLGNQVCDKVTGLCNDGLCDIGYWGPGCQFECPQGTYGSYCSKDCHCKEVNEQCNEVTGECHSGCAMGWSGKDCQTVIPCGPNLFGWDCNKTCYCNNPRHCDRFVGETSQCSSGQNETHLHIEFIVSIAEAALLTVSWIIIALLCVKQRRYKTSKVNASMYETIELKENQGNEDPNFTSTDLAHENVYQQTRGDYDAIEHYHCYETMSRVQT